MADEVKIRIAAVDAVGPGIDSAKQKFRGLEKELSASSQALLGFGKAIAAVGALEVGTKLATVAVQIFNGNLSEAVKILEQMPLGIGPAVRSIRELIDALSGAADEMKRLKVEQDAQDASLRKMFGEQSRRQDERRTIRKLDDEIAIIEEADQFERQKMKAAFKFREELNAAESAGLRITRQRLFELEIADISKAQAKAMSEADRKRHEEMMKLIDAETKERISANRRVFDHFRQASDELARSTDFLRIGIDIDESAIKERIKEIQRQTGTGQLAGGENMRFTTGLARSAEEAIRATSLKAESQRERQIQLLQEQLEVLKDQGQRIEPDFGIFGGAA